MPEEISLIVGSLVTVFAGAIGGWLSGKASGRASGKHAAESNAEAQRNQFRHDWELLKTQLDHHEEMLKRVEQRESAHIQEFRRLNKPQQEVLDWCRERNDDQFIGLEFQAGMLVRPEEGGNRIEIRQLRHVIWKYGEEGY